MTKDKKIKTIYFYVIQQIAVNMVNESYEDETSEKEPLLGNSSTGKREKTPLANSPAGKREKNTSGNSPVGKRENKHCQRILQQVRKRKRIYQQVREKQHLLKNSPQVTRTKPLKIKKSVGKRKSWPGKS